jgi:hypothetical protein
MDRDLLGTAITHLSTPSWLSSATFGTTPLRLNGQGAILRANG